ncbi:MAG: type VI secretion system protein TssA [Alphaproteobacteria bacterium]|nr:type VI secretion system protein TssA [Alphaproteobacteria bacterium]
MFLKKKEEQFQLLDKKTLALFLKPISKKEPSGKSLRYEKEYDKIRDAKKVEEDLPQGVWTHDLKEADWDKTAKLCIDALQTKSKDIQISLWLAECWFHEYQVYGLRYGLYLIQQLLEKFWDTVHPYSADDPEYRMSPLLWFDRAVTKALSQVIIALPTDDSKESFTFWDYRSRVLKTSPAEKEAANQKQSPSPKPSTLFYDAVKLTPTQFYKDLTNDLKETLKIIRDIEAFVENKYKDYPGILMRCRGHIEQILHFANGIYQERPPEISQNASLKPDKQAENNEFILSPLTNKSPSMLKSPFKIKGELQSREQAYDLLSKIADYLSEIEPHSPTPYLIRRAVNWGNMSLGELLVELGQQNGDIKNTMRFLGMDNQTHTD